MAWRAAAAGRPPSRAAAWSARLAVFGALVAVLTALLARARAVDTPVALVLMGSAFLFALAALFLAGAAAQAIWRDGRGGGGAALFGLALALALLAYPAALALQALRLPLLNDVATDVADPPEFSRSLRALAARGGLTPGPVAASLRQAQRAAYPNVQPITLEADAEEAYQLALNAAASLGWRVSEQSPPGGRAGVGHIDAVDRTPIMAFPDDIAIRIRPQLGETRIDLRSASRFGRHDFGANARRIAAFADRIQSLQESR